MNFSIARQHFYHEINQPDQQIDLAKAALYIALEEYPEIEIDAYMNALDTMADDVSVLLPAEPYPLRIIQVLNQYLFSDLAFSGNTEHYYDPDNSY